MEHALRKNMGWIVLASLSLFPVLLWIFMKPLDTRFSNFTTTMASLGQITGLAGLALFSLTLVLSTRLSFLDNMFCGLDRVYKAHRISGAVAFIFMLFHPLLLAMRYLPVSVESAASFLLPGNDLANTIGMASIASMVFLFALLFFTKFPYHMWKVFHKFLGVPFFFGGLHSFMVRSDISTSFFLWSYMLALAGIGSVSFVYRTLLGRLLVKRFEYIVADVRQISGGIIEISMEPIKKAVTFLPGQFIFVGFHNGNVSNESHPFSISSPPSDRKLRVSIKPLGDYTEQLKNLKKGAIAKIEGPFGKFSFSGCRNKSQIWIAGGIGITPYLSMARGLEGGYKIDLYYCSKNVEDAAFLNELNEIAARDSNFRVINYCSEKSGRLTAETVKQTSGLRGRDIFMCGPPVMMKGMRKDFIGLGVSPGMIHMEEFQFSEL